MAQWVQLSLANLLPSEIKTIFSAIDTLLTIVKTPLQAVSSILQISKSLLVCLSAFDPAKILRGLVEDFKNNFLGSGYYLLDMWDYPNVQMMRISDIGPDATYGAEEIGGEKFEDSFLLDLVGSFGDVHDFQRPMFTSDCAILVVLITYPDIDLMDLHIGEGNNADTWPGFASQVSGAAEQINESRTRVMFARARVACELQITEDPSRTAARVERLQEAFRLYSEMDPAARAALPVPMNPETGVCFFEDKYPQDIDWETDIVPLLQTIEAFASNAVYPNWTRAALRDIYPDLANAIATVLDAVIDLFPKGSNILDQIIELIDSIQAKLDELEAIIDQIDQFIENIEIILNSTGFVGIYIKGSSISDLKTKLLAATNTPANGFFAGMAIVAGGPTLAPFDMLFGTIAAVAS